MDGIIMTYEEVKSIITHDDVLYDTAVYSDGSSESVHKLAAELVAVYDDNAESYFLMRAKAVEPYVKRIIKELKK